MQKTEKQVIIPVHKVVDEILTKYKGSLPVISEQHMNEYLKEVGQISGILDQYKDKIVTRHGRKTINKFQRWELLTTHTARRSFATTAYLDGWDMLSIRMITGHSSDEQLLTYIKVTKEENAMRIAKKNQDNESKTIMEAIETLSSIRFMVDLSEDEHTLIQSIISRL